MRRGWSRAAAIGAWRAKIRAKVRASGAAGGVDLLRGRGRPDPAPTPGQDLGPARIHPGRAGVGQGLGPDLDRRAAGLPQRVPPASVLPAGHPPRASWGTPQPVRGRLRRPAVRRAPAAARPDHADLGQPEVRHEARRNRVEGVKPDGYGPGYSAWPSTSRMVANSEAGFVDEIAPGPDRPGAGPSRGPPRAGTGEVPRPPSRLRSISQGGRTAPGPPESALIAGSLGCRTRPVVGGRHVLARQGGPRRWARCTRWK